ncbi:MAG TPA: hypothetical protein EYQ54_05110 [Myxococcales bacterium]|nr:hypothetical protein [Myxococcales bacterium]
MGLQVKALAGSTFRLFPGSLFLVLLASLGPGGGGCSSPDPGDILDAPPRTIVLISVDTLRADHLGLYGHPRFTSPILDAFGAEGVVFEDVSATTAWTLPSHASMLTGLFPLRHGVMTAKTGLSDEVRTLAGWFSREGWDTAAVVNVLWLKRERYGLTREFAKYLSVEDPDYGRRGPSTWATDQAMEWIGEQGERPLFLFIHYYDVHADYASLPEYERLLVGPYEGPADGTAWQIERANFADAHVEYCLRKFDPEQCEFGSAEKARRIDSEMERIDFDASDVRHLEELYDAGIRQLDNEIGRLLAFLDARNRAKDSLVVITSDHGEEFMEHGHLAHFLTTYQQSLRVPLLMRGPGVPAGLRLDTPVSLVDLLPTLLGLAGLPPPTDIDGLDVSALWGESETGAFSGRYLYGEASGGVQQATGLPGIYPIFRSVRKGRFKLIQQSLGGAVEYALFDLEQDPAEQSDVASLHAEVVAELRGELVRRHAAGADAGPKGSEVELDESEVEQLRALGYAP